MVDRSGVESMKLSCNCPHFSRRILERDVLSSDVIELGREGDYSFRFSSRLNMVSNFFVIDIKLSENYIV